MPISRPIGRHMRAPLTLTLTLAVAAASCTNSPSQPSPAVSGSSTIAAGAPIAPGNGTVVGFGAQPLTLTVQNAIVTQSAPVTYTFEVATDTGFANKVQVKDGVAQGTAGQTAVRLDPTLSAGKDYFWHARAQGTGTTGVFGATYRFTVGPQVTLSIPTPIAPLAGAQTPGSPTFTVANVTRSGPAGPLTYRFEIADNAAFSSILASGTVPEGGNGTTFFAPSPDLPANRTLFWRATAFDPAAAASSTSTPLSFTTSLAIDLTRVIYLHTPANLSTWKQTGTIISVEQDGNAAVGGPMCIAFTDPGWPDTKWIYAGPNDPPDFGIYGNQWYFANIGGQWYAGPGEWLYRGAAVCKAGQGTNTIGPDSGFGGPFASWSPKPGELVGYAVSASARALPDMATVQERTNVVLQPWHDSALQGFAAGVSRAFGAGAVRGFPTSGRKP